MTTAVGIDVGKAALDLAIEGAPSVMRFANTKVGIGKLMARLGRLEEPRIVVEAVDFHGKLTQGFHPILSHPI